MRQDEAIQILSEGGLLTEEEVPMAKHVLFAAALTYVVAALSTFLTIATFDFDFWR